MYPSAHCEIGRPGGNGMRAAGSEATFVVECSSSPLILREPGAYRRKSIWFSISQCKPYDTQRVKFASVVSHRINTTANPGQMYPSAHCEIGGPGGT